jgi:hypothetical protein
MIRANYEKDVGPKELVILDGFAHAQFLFATDQGERLMGELLRFLSEPYAIHTVIQGCGLPRFTSPASGRTRVRF